MDSVSVSVLGHHGLSHTGDYELDITRSSPVLVATSDLFLPDDPSRPFSSFSSRAVPLDLFHSNPLIFEAPAEVSDFPHSIINMRKPGLSIRPHRPSASTVSQSGFEDQPSPSLSHTISTVVHRLTHSPSPSRAQLPIEDPQYSPPPLDLLDDDPFGTLCTPPASAPAFRTTFAQFDSESDLYYCPSPVAPAPSPSSPHRVLSPSSLSGGKSHSKRHSSHMSISILNFPSFTAPKSASPRSHSPLSLSPSLSFSLPRMKQRRLTKSFPKPPSLSVLARVHKIGKAPTSLRAGSVGARLPVDPWEQAQVRTTGSADDTDIDAMGDGPGVVAPSWTAIARPPWMSRNIVDLPPMPGSALGLSFSIPAHPDSLLPTDTTWESFPPSVSSHGEGYMSSSPERDSPVRHRRSVSELETSDLLSPLALFDDNSAGIMAAVSAEPEPEPEPVNLTPTPALTFSGSMSERSSLDELSDEEEESGYDEDGEGEDDYDDAMPTATLCDVSRTPFNSIYGAPEDFVDTDSDTSEDEDTSNSESNDCSSYYTFEDSRDGHGEPADAGSSSGSRSRSVPRLNGPANGSSSRSNGDASGSGWAPSAGGSGNGGHGRDGDDGGRDGRRGAMPTYARDSDESESEDDVPLGRSIPTALKAQRSIRRQVRDETTERRRLRSLRLAPSPSEPPVPASAQDHLRRSATAAARPAPRDGHVPPVPHNATVRMQAAAGAQDIIAPAPVLRARARAYTLTSKAENNEQAKADELTRRLMNVQVAGPSSIRHHHPQEPRHSADEFGAPKQQQQQQSLKPMRSFHRIRPAVLDALSVPPPPAPAPLSAPAPTSSLSRASSRVRRERREYSPSKPPSSRPSLDRDEQAPTAAATSSRSRSVRRPNTAGAASTSVSSPPLPALPPSQGAFQVVSRDQPTAAATSQKLHAWQQRVYVFDLQSFHMVEIGAGTSAGDVLACLKQQGHLDSWAGVGVWTLFEACQDAGMERPLRAFEIVQDVIKSWDSSRAHNNALVARKSTMAGVLASSAIPGVSPRKSGYVEYEAKRGSWKRRWLELREQGLFLSKKDTGKDEIFLCSVSNFDAYILTAPRSGGKSKLFTFAVKSTDSVTFFENKNDYVHLFACGETEGRSWIEKIMLARSYVINQERNVIQSMPQGPTTPGALAGGSKALTRAGTVRTGMRPAQPLLDISPLPAAVAHPPPARVFEPGSLLAGR